jgi:hypothetical protein
MRHRRIFMDIYIYHQETKPIARAIYYRPRTDGDRRAALAFISKMRTLEYFNIISPAVKYNWRNFFDFHFGYDKTKHSKYEGDVHTQLSYDLKVYKKSDEAKDRADYPYMSAEESGDEVNWRLSD